MKRVSNAEGMETVVILTKVGKTDIIENVFYVPNMKCNLLTVGKMVEKGFSVTMKGELLRLYEFKDLYAKIKSV